MDRLVWDEIDFIEIAEAIPEVEEFETHHRFELERGNKKCVLQLWQLEGFAEILVSDVMSHADTLKIAFYCRAECKVDKKNEYILFSDCVFAENMFTYLDKGNIYEKEKNPYGNEVKLYVSRANIYLEIT